MNIASLIKLEKYISFAQEKAETPSVILKHCIRRASAIIKWERFVLLMVKKKTLKC